MKLAILLALAACQAGSGGGSTSTGNGGGDAGTGGDGDGGALVTGRVCILKDLRQPTLCDDTKDASHLVLRLGNRPAVPLSQRGVFSFAAHLGTDDLAWHVQGAVVDQIIPSVMGYGTDTTIPVIETGLYTEFLNTVSVVIPDQQGSIVVRVLSGGRPASGVKATTTRPTTNGETFYDGSTPLNWATDTTTGSFGVVWFPGVPLANTPPTTAKIGLSVLGGPTVTTTATLENQAITFVTSDIQP
jgi:hypothetical protein